MTSRLPFFLFAFLATAIGLYPLVYTYLAPNVGLLSTKSPELLQNTLWQIGFYGHITFGGLALLSGWSQFNAGFRNHHLIWHRRLGKTYTISATLSGLCAIYIALYATGGMISALGFISLGIIWLYTTLQAYRHIRNRDTNRHRRMMIYSYAACFAAVTLRIWLPLLSAVFQDFTTAYRIVAWLCWVPNLAVGHFIFAPTSKTH